MEYQHYIAEALDMVSAWELPEEDFAQTVNDQARIMAGMYLDLPHLDNHCSPYTPLQF
jgi:hypothetical protein